MSFRVAPSLAHYQVLPSQFMSSQDARHRSYKLVVGVLIFANEKVLLLQRSATERHYPNIWELPSGKVEPEDATVLDAAARECLEETGLTITEFTGQGKGFEYGIDGRKTLQLNFKVEVRNEDEVTINPDEHQGYKWCTKKEVGEVGGTEATLDILKDTFSGLRGNQSGKAI
jgi:8-oxo-dGTP pyrophosphatase MutT (NUDIX family)